MLSPEQFWKCEDRNKPIYYCSITELTIILRILINKQLWNLHGDRITGDLIYCIKDLLNHGTSIYIPEQCCSNRDRDIIKAYHLTQKCPEIPIRLIRHSVLNRVDCNRHAYFNSANWKCEELFDNYEECAEYCVKENDLYLDKDRIFSSVIDINTFLQLIMRRL